MSRDIQHTARKDPQPINEDSLPHFCSFRAPHKRNMAVPAVKMMHNDNNFRPGLNQTLSIIASLEVKSTRPSFTSIYIKGCRAAHVGREVACTIQDQLTQAGSAVSGEKPFTHRHAAHIKTESFLIFLPDGEDV